ncbi:MAG: hypothetical protein ACXWNI_05680 [Candidatus Limnocylindrales bacterium]
MNSQLPPVDPVLQAHLARRSAGPLPEGLADQVLQTVDAAPVKPKYAWRALSSRSARTAPRTLLAGAGLAAVVLLVAALAVAPRFQMTPAASRLAGYPADRALTTAELAALMAGPALPTNTTLVADVVIDIRTDVCPMDRYGTVGIVEGMASQVCVMTASDVLTQPVTISGIMAFRYLAPGYLGLLGEIAPAAPAKVAFRVADDWPLQGKTFLVEGWLYRLDGWQGYSQVPGAESMGCPANTPEPAGDPLDPTGSDVCVYSWLTDKSIAAPPGFASGQPITSEQTRSVEAAGMELIDAIPSDAAVHGVYVVRSVTEPCPGAPPQDSRGCGGWRVLAKVADISLPALSGSPLKDATEAPTTAPPATLVAPSLTGVIGSGNQPLAADELETLMVEQPDHLARRTVIIAAPIPTQISCQSDASGGGCAVNTKPLAIDGAWAVSIRADGTLSLVGQIATPTAGGYVFKLDQLRTWSGGVGFVIVDAWLDWENGCDSATDPPYGSVGCGTSLLTAEKLTWMHMAALLPAGAVVTWVQSDAYRAFGSQALSDGVHGLYLVEVANQTAPRILARLEPLTP